MNPTLLQRQAALAGVALLAAVGALALGRDDSSPGLATTAPAAVTWRSATVGVAEQAGGCQAPVAADTVGVVHPVLPCAVKLVVSAHGAAVRTEVVGRGPVGREDDFDLTAALAARLGVDPGATVRWRFAR